MDTTTTIVNSTVTLHNILPFIIACTTAITTFLYQFDPQTIPNPEQMPLVIVVTCCYIHSLLGDVQRLSEGILELNQDISFSNPSEAVGIYSNLIDLQTSMENLFEVWQSNIQEFENTLGTAPATSIFSEMFMVCGNDIRTQGNLLVKAMRSLEDNIRDNNPAFEFLTRQWFE